MVRKLGRVQVRGAIMREEREGEGEGRERKDGGLNRMREIPYPL